MGARNRVLADSGRRLANSVWHITQRRRARSSPPQLSPTADSSSSSLLRRHSSAVRTSCNATSAVRLHQTSRYEPRGIKGIQRYQESYDNNAPFRRDCLFCPARICQIVSETTADPDINDVCHDCDRPDDEFRQRCLCGSHKRLPITIATIARLPIAERKESNSPSRN